MKFFKIRDVQSPKRSTDGSAGIDFFVPNDFETQTVNPGETILIPMGVKLKVPFGMSLIGFNKSGISTKRDLILLACVVDSDYQGEFFVSLKNAGTKPQTIKAGEKIAQSILINTPLVQLEEVFDLKTLFPEKTERGEGGFGSTGNI